MSTRQRRTEHGLSGRGSDVIPPASFAAESKNESRSAWQVAASKWQKRNRGIQIPSVPRFQPTNRKSLHRSVGTVFATRASDHHMLTGQFYLVFATTGDEKSGVELAIKGFDREKARVGIAVERIIMYFAKPFLAARSHPSI